MPVANSRELYCSWLRDRVHLLVVVTLVRVASMPGVTFVVTSAAIVMTNLRGVRSKFLILGLRRSFPFALRVPCLSAAQRTARE